MIARSDGRRKAGGGLSGSYSDDYDEDDVFDPYSFSSQEAASADDVFAFSSQDSSHFDSCSRPAGGVLRKPKRRRKGEVDKGDTADFGFLDYSVLRGTSTLMETQEFGEMREHVDEVMFALDGLGKGRPTRIRRASLLSLLRICSTSSQRRLLRSQGMVKSILDAIMGLSFDDSQSNMAAAALFYILISDGQDEHLLESHCCIRFLIKLLKPVTSAATEDKLPRIGSKILRVKNDAEIPRGTSNKLDHTSISIINTVKEILGSCNYLKSTFEVDCALARPELSAKWIALLTMEKAKNSGIVRKTEGNFKEKLREFGGLDAVFEAMMHCHSIIEDNRDGGSSMCDARDGTLLESLVLLLRCLKIMENAAFLGKDNQDYLLKMQGDSDCRGYHESFTKLVLNVIRILSGLSLRKSSYAAAHRYKSNLTGGNASELTVVTEDKASDEDTSSQLRMYNINQNNMTEAGADPCQTSDDVFSIWSFKERSSTEASSLQRSFDTFQCNHRLSSGHSRYSLSFSEINTSSMNGGFYLKSSVTAASDSCGKTSSSSSCRASSISNRFKNFSRDKRSDLSESSSCDLSEYNKDPSEFDDYEIQPSKWVVLSGKKKKNRSSKVKNRSFAVRETKALGDLQQLKNRDSDSPKYPLQELNTCENGQSEEASCSGASGEESSSLLADCLLTAVKVLMNLTNENMLGCRQIAACGGLETMASIIAAHCPSFSLQPSFSFSLCENREFGVHDKYDQWKENHLTDQELDLLVAILGLLVNSVEKDENNRCRLARASVTVNESVHSHNNGQKDVISLLCSIFLANRGDTEMAGEENNQTWDPEAMMEQGEKEAEKMIVEAYAALLLAFLSTESKRTRDAIAGCLPNHNLSILVPVLERFVAFHLTLNMMTPETHTAVSEVIESCRVP